MGSEVGFQDKLRELIQGVSRKFRFDSLEISKVVRDYSIDSKKRVIKERYSAMRLGGV